MNPSHPRETFEDRDRDRIVENSERLPARSPIPERNEQPSPTDDDERQDD